MRWSISPARGTLVFRCRSLGCLLLVALLSRSPAAGAGRPGEKPAEGGELKPLLGDAEREAIGRGLAYLAGSQGADGSYDLGSANVGVTGLAGIAFLSSGSTPTRGPHAENIRKVVDYVLSCCDPSTGYINSGNSRMYEHGFATLFLAEVFGMTAEDRVRGPLTRAVRLMEAGQNHEGGWRYYPVAQDADMSVTICCVMALRAARNAGIPVSKRTIDRAIEYVKASQNPDGGFSYVLNSRSSGFARSAAGLCSLYYAGIYEGEQVAKALEYLEKNVHTADRDYIFYACYYASQAFHQAGPDVWHKHFPVLRRMVLARQQADGSFHGRQSVDYATSMALIVLQMPNELVPIFQR